jgi:DNA polymerase III epsilon subunit-like protein
VEISAHTKPVFKLSIWLKAESLKQVHGNAIFHINDGIKLMKRPESNINTNNAELSLGFSNAAKQRLGKKRRRDKAITSYVLLDIETTGLSSVNNEIPEIGIVEILAGKIAEQHRFIIRVNSVPAEIEKL